MTTLSSSRIIKRPDTTKSAVIEQYIPPRELFVKSGEPVPKGISFPHYKSDGREAGEYHLNPGKEPVKEEKKVEAAEGQPEEEEDPKQDLLREWKEEARKALEEARREADQILEKAKDEAHREQERAREAGLREGYEAGYREGREKAEEECRQELEDTLSSFREDMHQALKSVETAKEKCIRNYLDQLKDCAVAVGEKVIHISLRSSGEVIKQMIVSATEKLKKTAWVKIYIDKPDYDMMMEADADILDELSHLSDNIKFIVMDKEDRGNCIIEMPEEIIDVSVNTQMENIKDILENVRV
ncbi:MAG: flagellar biosynthesis/type III secretory pathway protein [Lachnospiraceae bacterium]|nr:flagellar biosynthesis/type III secretory pathway protein [Lachnospiraceae bacterium]